jgi:hypothetical protein
LQPVPMVTDVGQLFRQPGFGRDLAALCLRPVAEGRHQWHGSGMSSGETLAGQDAADNGNAGDHKADCPF